MLRRTTHSLTHSSRTRLVARASNGGRIRHSRDNLSSSTSIDYSRKLECFRDNCPLIARQTAQGRLVQGTAAPELHQMRNAIPVRPRRAHVLLTLIWQAARMQTTTTTIVYVTELGACVHVAWHKVVNGVNNGSHEYRLETWLGPAHYTTLHIPVSWCTMHSQIERIAEEKTHEAFGGRRREAWCLLAAQVLDCTAVTGEF